MAAFIVRKIEVQIYPLGSLRGKNFINLYMSGKSFMLVITFKSYKHSDGIGNIVVILKNALGFDS
jgi:hypothetical protein